MLIAQISDTHILAPGAPERAAESRTENLRRCVADINWQGVDIVLHTGDSVQNGVAEEYAFLRDILSDLEAPLYIVPGNRDRAAALRETLDHLGYLPGEGEFLHYAVEDYPLRLIGMDTTCAGERKGFFCAERRGWLEETLSAEPEKPTLLFFHHPPFDVPSEGYIDGYRNPAERETLTAVVSRHPQVVQILCGHVHSQNRRDWGGTVVTTMPSVAVDVRKGVDTAIGEAPLYMLHRFEPGAGVDTGTRVAA